MSADRDLLLEKIMAAGSRRRRRGALAVCGCLLVVAGVIGTVATNQDEPPGDTIAALGQNAEPPGGYATTTLPRKIIKEEDAITTTSTSRPDRNDEADSESPDPTTTTVPAAELVCRNSTDSRCGDFSWTSPFVNAPLVLEVEASATAVKVGDEVVLHVTASDADAAPRRPGDGCTRSSVGWPGSLPGCVVACSQPARFGPWDPPPAAPGEITFDSAHTFETPGEYSIVVQADSGSCGDYASAASRTITITVTEPDPPPEP